MKFYFRSSSENREFLYRGPAIFFPAKCLRRLDVKYVYKSAATAFFCVCDFFFAQKNKQKKQQHIYASYISMHVYTNDIILGFWTKYFFYKKTHKTFKSSESNKGYVML